VQPLLSRNTELIAKALEARWMNSVEIKQVASPEDVKALHEYAMSLTPAVKLYKKHVVPLVQLAHSRGVFISDRMIVEKMFKLFLAYLALRGTISDAIAFQAATKLIRYVARTPEELSELDRALEELFGEVAELKKKLEEAKYLLEVGEYKSALSKFKEVALYDVETLADRPWMKDYVKTVVEEAQRYVKKIGGFLSQVR
jgi:S-methylmethionine-dependent homocysteine/selenocysteine methylase